MYAVYQLDGFRSQQVDLTDFLGRDESGMRVAEIVQLGGT